MACVGVACSCEICEEMVQNSKIISKLLPHPACAAASNLPAVMTGPGAPGSPSLFHDSVAVDLAPPLVYLRAVFRIGRAKCFASDATVVWAPSLNVECAFWSKIRNNVE